MDRKSRNLFYVFAERLLAKAEQRALDRMVEAGIVPKDTQRWEFHSPLGNQHPAQDTLELMTKQELRKIADEISETS